MRTETINIYKFEELEQEAQDKAIMDVANNPHYLDYDWWDFMHDDFHERLKEIGIECQEFYWDIDRGRYFRMEKARITDTTKFLTSAGFTKEILMLCLDDQNAINNIGININEERECTNTISVDFIDFEDSQMDEVKNILGYNFIEEFEEKLTNYLQSILNGFLKELDDEYDYMNSEYIKEELINNDYEFNCDGGRYNGK